MKILVNKILPHLAFWLVSWLTLLNNFQASSQLAPTDYIFTAIFMSFIVLAVYTNLYSLIKLTNRNTNLLVIILTSALITIFYTVGLVVGFDPLVEWLFPNYYLISYFDFYDTGRYFIVFIFVSSLIYFAQSWFSLKQSEAQVVRLEKEKLNAELDTLRKQVNPHFLFNSLNSIYALVLAKSDDAPEALLKLSDALRYVIYEANSPRVELMKEIEFIEHYIGLQTLRLRKRDKLDVDIDVKHHHLSIAPLLLISVVENCFKHGLSASEENCFIDIRISTDDKNMCIATRNKSYSQTNYSEYSGGTGLMNLKSRLEVEYPGRYNLNIEQGQDIFTVELEIEL